jgi:SecD/SecF fusion protein
MAVDANVLIFERIKEEVRSGSSIRTAIDRGFKKAFVTILDANLTTVIAAFFLLQFGTGPIKGFAIALIIGICASMFTALFVSKVIFQLITPSRSLFKPRRKNESGVIFGFMNKRNRWIAVSLSLVILLVGTLLFVGKGFNTGIDFAGGIMMDVRFDETTSPGQLRKQLDSAGVKGAVIQETGTSGRTFLVKSPDSTEEKVDAIKKGLSGVGEYRLSSLERVGPQIGEGLKKKTTLAAVWALLGMLIYIAFRFRFIYGVAAVLTLIHDVLISLTVLLIFNIEISLPVAAALMMVIGYSLNDTIVIFDRVRENLKNRGKAGKTSITGLINQSINQTLSRTMVTSGTTLTSVLALLLMGSGVLAAFAFTFAAGILIGTYSSIFLSCMLLTRT